MEYEQGTKEYKGESQFIHRWDISQKPWRAMFSHSMMAAAPTKGNLCGRGEEVTLWVMGWFRRRTLELSPKPASCFLSRSEIPTCPTPLSQPSASCSCTQACQCKLVITTLRKPDQPTAAGNGCPHGKSLVDLLIKGALEHPDGGSISWSMNGFLGCPHVP